MIWTPGPPNCFIAFAVSKIPYYSLLSYLIVSVSIIILLILNYIFENQELVVKQNLLHLIYLHYTNNDRRERNFTPFAQSRRTSTFTGRIFLPSNSSSMRRTRRLRRFESILRRVNYICAPARFATCWNLESRTSSGPCIATISCPML